MGATASPSGFLNTALAFKCKVLLLGNSSVLVKPGWLVSLTLILHDVNLQVQFESLRLHNALSSGASHVNTLNLYSKNRVRLGCPVTLLFSGLKGVFSNPSVPNKQRQLIVLRARPHTFNFLKLYNSKLA